MDELGISSPEEMGYDKPELWLEPEFKLQELRGQACNIDRDFIEVNFYVNVSMSILNAWACLVLQHLLQITPHQLVTFDHANWNEVMLDIGSEKAQ